MGHGTDSFTSPPKEGMRRFFSDALGLNPRTRVPEASMLTTRPPMPSTIMLNRLVFKHKFLYINFLRMEHNSLLRQLGYCMECWRYPSGQYFWLTHTHTRIHFFLYWVLDSGLPDWIDEYSVLGAADLFPWRSVQERNAYRVITGHSEKQAYGQH